MSSNSNYNNTVLLLAVVKSSMPRWWKHPNNIFVTDKDFLDQQATPADWKPAQRRQKDIDVSWTKKHGKSYHGYKLSLSADRKYKFIRKQVVSTAKEHDTRHFEQVLDAQQYQPRCVSDEMVSSPLMASMCQN